MGYDPFAEHGRAIGEQIRNWESLDIQPYPAREIGPYTRARIILMNGIEVESALFSHQLARHTGDMELKRQLAMVRRVEQQQQKAVNWLIPGTESTLDVTLGYEQVAVDLTAWLARTEPDPTVKAALDFALIEDFDHLYRYANLLDLIGGRDPASVVGEFTEIFPGRPTISEHRHPFDAIRVPYDGASADLLTKLHVMTIIAAEQQTMNFYMNVGNRQEDTVGRGLYLEIAQIEEQHVSHYESLADPRASWLEQLVLHEYNECYLYHSCLVSEDDLRVRQVWQRHLDEEVEHLRLAGELMKRHEGRDPVELFGDTMPEPTIFEPNKDYVRAILGEQVDLTARGTEYVPAAELGPESNYRIYQHHVNGNGFVPSQRLIQDHIARFGRDYRLETNGPHPVGRFRTREAAMA
jgi:hypothetical protein